MLFKARIASTPLLQLLDLVRRLLRQVYLAYLLGPFPVLSLSPGLAFCALPIRSQALLKSLHLQTNLAYQSWQHDSKPINHQLAF